MIKSRFEIHQYPIKGLKVPTFVTDGVQMVVEVNYAPGDKFQIGYKSVNHQSGPRILRKKAASTTATPPMMSTDFTRTYGYKPTQNGESPADEARLANPNSRTFESSGPFKRIPPSSNYSPSEQTSPMKPGGWSFPESSADNPIEEQKDNQKSLILGLIWTGAFIILLTGISAVIYIRHHVKINSSRRRTEQRLEAKL